MKHDALQRTKAYFIGGLALAACFVILSLIVGVPGALPEAALIAMLLLGSALWVLTLTSLTEAKGYPRSLGLFSLTLIGGLVLAVLPDRTNRPPVRS